MTYSVKEIFYTLQGEGKQAGRPAVFCRFAGCNLWNGIEQDREKSICKFCDTDFIGMDGNRGGKYSSAAALSDQIAELWPSAHPTHRFVVLTGGEPLLQLDEELISALHERKFTIAVETNGTIQPPQGIDWLCVSPKGKANLVVKEADELKFVYPQRDLQPQDLDLGGYRNLLIQPMDGLARKANTKSSVQYCLENPKWQLSVQTHKVIGIP